MKSLEGRFTSLNAAFEAMTGWNRASWIGRSFTGIVHPGIPFLQKPFSLDALEAKVREVLGPA